MRAQVEHDNKEWEQQGVLSNADLSHAEYGDLVIDWEKLDYASARTARQIANIAYTLVVRLLHPTAWSDSILGVGLSAQWCRA